MALEDTISTLITEAAAAEKSIGEVFSQVQTAIEDMEIKKLRTQVQSLTVSAPEAQWQQIRTALTSRRTGTPDRRDEALRVIGAAVKNNQQAVFWRALLVLGLMVRDSMPHLDSEFQEPPA